MKKFIPLVLLVIFSGLIIFFFSWFYKHNEINIKSANLKWDLKVKGIKGARDFIFDEEGNCYIAFATKIQYIDKSGKSIILLKDDKLDISSITYLNDKIYFTSGNKLVSFDLESRKTTELIKDLPNFGDYKDSKIIVKDNKSLLITIGAATNSGVVGEDNLWLKDNPFQHDVSPKNLTISGKSSSKLKTGAFVPYNTKNIPGQIIPAHSPGNASVVAYYPENSSMSLFAWGIRNIKGLDINSEGKIFFSVGGMEDRGVRPVKGDVDYIYELKENLWYGWPDYSGGDPINSPRFKGNGNERIPFLLDKQPTTNPPAPIYQHKTLNSLGDIVIDKQGSLGNKDSIYFYETKDNTIYEISKTGIVKEKLKFDQDILFKSMKMFNGDIYLIDSDRGQLGAITSSGQSKMGFNKTVGYYLLALIGVIIISIMWKIKN